MRTMAALVALFSSGCAVVVAGLEPRPNIPAVTKAPAISLDLGPNIKQEQTLTVGGATIELQTFRGDLKRAFLAGFPGATTGSSDLVLNLSDVDMTYENLRIAGLVRMRFRGTLLERGTTLVSFAGRVDGDACTDTVDSCFRSAIETLFEKLYGEMSKAPAPETKPKTGTTEI